MIPLSNTLALRSARGYRGVFSWRGVVCVSLLVGGAAALDVADDGLVELLALLDAHFGGEGGGGLPLGRGTRGGLLEHLVDLLEGEALWMSC